MTAMSGATSKAAVAAGVTATTLHVVAAAPLGPTLSLVFFVQFMVFAPATNEMTPGNVQDQVGDFTPLARMDPADFGIDLGGSDLPSLKSGRMLNDENNELPTGLQYLGYKSGDFWANIGIARVLIVGYLILLCIFGIVWILMRRAATNTRSMKCFKWFQRLMFWNGVILLLMIGANVIFTSTLICFKSCKFLYNLIADPLFL